MRWKEALKGLLAVAVVFWLVRSGKLDPGSLHRALRNPSAILGAVVLIYLGMAGMAWRWNVLLKAQGIALGFAACFSLTMIGMVFGTFTPGGAGGDLARIYYVGERAETKGKVVLSIIMDRLLGLLSLLLLASIVAAWNYRTVIRDPKLALLYGFVVTSAISGLILLAAAMGASAAISRCLRRMATRFRFLGWAASCADALGVYSKTPSTLFLALLLSPIAHLATCAIFVLLFRTNGAADVSLKDLALTVPVALAASAIPITPAGIGVGQVAFFTILQLVAGRGRDGSNAFTIYQCVYIAVSLTGLIFYFAQKKRLTAPVVECVA